MDAKQTIRRKKLSKYFSLNFLIRKQILKHQLLLMRKYIAAYMKSK